MMNGVKFNSVSSSLTFPVKSTMQTAEVGT